MGALRPDLKCARDAGALIDQVSILNRVWIYVSHALDVIAMARYESAARGIKRLTEFPIADLGEVGDFGFPTQWS
jgi:hypothetical protein